MPTDLDPEMERKVRAILERVEAFHIAVNKDPSQSNVLDEYEALGEFLKKVGAQ